MSMEETFIVTWVCSILLGVGLGLLAYWAFEKDTRDGEDS